MSEIKEAGVDYDISKKTGEIHESLKTLIPNHDYSLTCSIRPLDQSSLFEISGQFKSQYSAECSRCAEDFTSDLNFQFNDLLMPEVPLAKDENHSHGQLSQENTTDKECFEYPNPWFDLGLYIHEIAFVRIGTFPAPKCDSKGICSFCGIDTNAKKFEYHDAGFEKKESAFNQLKNLKIKQ